MNPSLYIAFLIATLALILLPGPTVMLITSKSLRHGVSSGLMAVAGCALAAAVQLLIVLAGLASVVVFVSDWFEWIRWAGVVYLIYLGVRTWLDSANDAAGRVETSVSTTGCRDFADGFLVTLANPKMLLFHGAFLQQFVDPRMPALPQLLVLAGSFLVIAVILDSVWAVLAARLGRLVAERRSHRLANRLAGSILIVAGATLALMRRTGLIE
jgi:threonine/homoserine/homoserine lactone efflux protein